MNEKASWSRTKLREILTDIQPGFASGAHNANGQGLPHFRPMNVSREGAIDRSDLKYVSEALVDRPTRRLRRGDVLFNNTNSPELVGKTALFDDDDEPAFSNHMTRLRADESRVDPGYLAQALHQIWRSGWFASHCNNHVSQASVSRSVLQELEVALPPLDVQRAFVHLQSDVIRIQGSLQHHVQSGRRALDHFADSILEAACSGRLTTDWRDKYRCPAAPAAPALSSAAVRHASFGDNTSDLIGLPDSWAWWAIESVCSHVIDYRGRTPPHQAVGPIPHIRTTQIRSGRINWQTDRFVTQAVYDKYMTRGIPCQGDVLFTMEAPLGEVGLVDRSTRFSIAQRILLLRPGPVVSSEYLALALRSKHVRHAIDNRATGSGVRGIAFKRLRSVELPVPPVAEQHEIVERVRGLTAVADSVSARLQVATDLAQTGAQTALASAFGQSNTPLD